MMALIGLLLLLMPMEPTFAQNIPPLIGGPSKPGWKFPNPLDRTQTEQGKDATQQKNSNQQTSSAIGEKDVARFLEGWQSGFARKDLSALAACYLQNPDLRVYHEGREFAGWEPFKTELEQMLARSESFQVELKDPELRVFGRFAWVTSHYQQRQWTGGAPRVAEGSLTLILEKRRNLWTILHQHASAQRAEGDRGQAKRE
jgi:ketosteroid isomerase-like protein